MGTCPGPSQLHQSTMYLTLAQSDFSTAEVSDALIKLGVPHGGHIPDIYRIAPHPRSESGALGVRLCGPAYTVRIVLASDHIAPKLQQSHFVDLAPEGSVAFVSAPLGWLLLPSSHPHPHPHRSHTLVYSTVFSIDSLICGYHTSRSDHPTQVRRMPSGEVL